MKAAHDTLSNPSSYLTGDIFPDLLWILFWSGLLYFGWNSLQNIIITLIERIKAGGAIKIWQLELGAIQAVQSTGNPNNLVPIMGEEPGEVWHNYPLEVERNAYYDECRKIMLVHKLFKSNREGYLYDVLIYVIPHKIGHLNEVISVEYFFGAAWLNQVYTSGDRGNSFKVLNAAYGPFLCQAKIVFNDGASRTVFRYIDFEMGEFAPIVIR